MGQKHILDLSETPSPSTIALLKKAPLQVNDTKSLSRDHKRGCKQSPMLFVVGRSVANSDFLHELTLRKGRVEILDCRFHKFAVVK